jgi:putative ABC transport system permease protein
MGKIVVVTRLVLRDLRRTPLQAGLMLLVILGATTTLTLGLALHGVISQPYQQTRRETAGPDVVVSYVDLPPMPKGATPAAALAAMRALTRARGVTGHVGPYPIGWATLRTGRLTAGVIAEGRPLGRASIDRPKLTQGSWISADGVVIERSFADALGVRVGQRVTLGGRPFRVAGIAVSTADVPYPNADFFLDGTPYPSSECGLVWVTEAAARSFATPAQPLSYVTELRLDKSATAQAFAQAHPGLAGTAGHHRGRPFISSQAQLLDVTPWQQIAQEDAKDIMNEQLVLLTGSWLLGMLAVASVAVVVGGRMTEQTRRVGLLKAVGGTPRFVATVLLTENLLLAVVAAAAGLVVGWLSAPLLTSPGGGLVGSAGAPSVTGTTVELVAAVAVAVALVATFVPALRAARTSTVEALADSARRPRRRGALVALSRGLPVPLLVGLRLAIRRPRRAVLAGCSVAITATTIVAVLSVHAKEDQVLQSTQGSGLSALADPRFIRLDQVLLVLTVMLAVLAAINAVFITQATASDARHSCALSRALGVRPNQVAAALSVSQLIPALPGALLGIPLGVGLVRAVGHGGTSAIPLPPAWWLILMVVGMLVVLAALTAIPARASARRSPAEILQAESA